MSDLHRVDHFFPARTTRSRGMAVGMKGGDSAKRN